MASPVAKRHLLSNKPSSSTDQAHLSLAFPRKQTRLTAYEKSMLFLKFQEIQRSPGSSYGKITALAKQFNVSRAQIYRISAGNAKVDASCSAEETPIRGRRKIFTPQLDAVVRQISANNHFKLSPKRLALHMGYQGVQVSGRTVQRHVNYQQWRRTRVKTVPLLTAVHKHARSTWAKRHLLSKWTTHVDIDEKYFYGTLLQGTRLIPPNVPSPKTAVQHKSHIPKVMMLTAVARPNCQHSFDGKVGIWPITEAYVAKKSSKNHKKGEVYQKHVSMTGDRLVHLMKRFVVPAVRRKMRWCSMVTIQMDNAPPHVALEQLEKEINQQRWRQRTKIRLLRQPAQSPDTNVNDLGLYAFLQRELDLQQTHVESEQELEHSILAVWRKLDHTTLEKLYKAKSTVLTSIIKHNGANDFPMPHA